MTWKFSVEKISRFMRNTSGGIAIMFGLMLPMMMGAVGLSVDFARAYLVQQRLAQALDAAALAGAAASTDAASITAKVNQFFQANYPPEVLGAEFTPEVHVDGNHITITGRANYQTEFMKFLGIQDLDVTAKTVVQREVRGLEVVMVLDNTGSMEDEMDSLKEASHDFIDIIFNAALEEDDVRIGMVPYSSAVNIGPYGLGKNPDGSTYDDGTAFVTLPSGVTYTSDPASKTNWNGCVVEHKGTDYDSSATHVANSKGQLWQVGSGNWKGHGWNPASTSNDPAPNDSSDSYEGPWDIYTYGRVIANGARCSSQGSGYATSRCSSCNSSTSSPSGNRDKCNTTHCMCWHSDVNIYCPAATVFPLSSDREALHDHVDTMQAEGATVPSLAMNWGFRILSPERPFREAAPWNDEHWQKAVLFMTDGETSMGGDMTGYWASSRNSISNTTINDRLKATCTTLKNSDHNVKIYTVIFGSLDDATRAVYQSCATTTSQYYEALTEGQLVEVFNDIARDLANLHISE